MYTKCHSKQPVPRDRGSSSSRMQAVQWWIEMSDGHNRGRILNWLTDPSLWKERVAEPLRPAINLLLKDNDDLLHSNHWVSQKEWNKEEGAVRISGCSSFPMRLHVLMPHVWRSAHFRSDTCSCATMQNHLNHVLEIVPSQSVKPQGLHWMAPIIPCCIIILIFSSILYT